MVAGHRGAGVGGGASSVRHRTLLAAPPLSPPLSPTQCPLPSSLPSGLVLEQSPSLSGRSAGSAPSAPAAAIAAWRAVAPAAGGRAGAAVRRGTARNLAEQCGRGRCGEGGDSHQCARQPPRASQRRWRRRRAGRRGRLLASWCS